MREQSKGVGNIAKKSSNLSWIWEREVTLSLEREPGAVHVGLWAL